MHSQIFVQTKLTEVLTDLRSRDPNYSLRAFAKKLAMSPAAVSEILHGKRRISRKMGERIARHLQLTVAETEEFLRNFPEPRVGRKPSARARKVYNFLDMEQFHLICDWHHFAILSLCETTDFQGDAGWIADRLGLAPSEVDPALERLTRLGLIARGPDGKLQITGENYSTADEVANAALRKAHHQDLDLARKSLEHDALHARDFTSLTMAIDSSRIPEAKKIIREFRDRMSGLLEGGTRDEVYKMTIHLMPLSRRSSKDS